MRAYTYRGHEFNVELEKEQWSYLQFHLYIKIERSTLGKLFHTSDYKYKHVYKVKKYDDYNFNEKKIDAEVNSIIKSFFCQSKNFTLEGVINLTPEYSQEILELKEEKLSLLKKNNDLNIKINKLSDMKRNVEHNNDFLKNN